jgi:dUTP pyrophosphatase
MKFYLTRDVIKPERGTPESAGIDFFIPKFNQTFIDDFLTKNPTLSINLKEKTIELGPGERVMIPAGVKSIFEDHSALIAFNKSGVATKLGLIVGAAVVDSDYTGEIHISLVNSSTENYIQIAEDQKIVQFLHIPIQIQPIEFIEEYNRQTERGEGGFGSTDKK